MSSRLVFSGRAQLRPAKSAQFDQSKSHSTPGVELSVLTITSAASMEDR